MSIMPPAPDGKIEPRPHRIQRRRTRGWRMPEGAIYVGRPSRWGNPFVVRPVCSDGIENCWSIFSTTGAYVAGDGALVWDHIDSAAIAAREAVELFREWLGHHPSVFAAARHDLSGRDLACWCPLDQPCHADVLLEIANGGGR